MGPRDPIDVFAAIARSLARQDTLESTLQRIVELAVETVPGAGFAAISVVQQRRTVDTVAATDDVCMRVDLVQHETGQGPCLDAIWEQPRVGIDDLAATERWPAFSQRAVDIGIRSMLSFRLFLEHERTAALNLYASKPAAFGEESVRLGDVFAAHASVAWDHAKEADHLHEAMESRNLIGQAQGILMASHRISAEEAFRLLRAASQRKNLKLRDVALEVTQTGTLTDAP